MLYENPDSAPCFLRHSFKFKGVKDVVNFKSITNPIGYMKDTVKTIKKSPLEGGTMLTQPLIGAGARPAAVTQFVNSKGKDRFDPNRPLSSSLLPNYEAPPAPSIPEAPVPDAPYSMRSRSVTDAARQARQDASKRKGFLNTLFAKETGGFGGTGSGASLLGG